MGGDLDGDGSFTVNDAAFSAAVQFLGERFPWDNIEGRRRRRRLDAVRQTSLDVRSRLRVVKRDMQPSALQVDVFIGADDHSPHHGGELSPSVSAPSGQWKALSVQFTGGMIAAIEMKQGTSGQIATQHSGRFFQAAELSGQGLSWPHGLAATVTFEAGTDLRLVNVDYDSINTYIVEQDDPRCVAGVGSHCETHLIQGGTRSSGAAEPPVAGDTPAEDVGHLASSKEQQNALALSSILLMAVAILAACLIICAIYLRRREAAKVLVPATAVAAGAAAIDLERGNAADAAQWCPHAEKQWR